MDENRLEKIMFGLVNHGIKKVVVHYEGGGDSGAIEYVHATQDPDIGYYDLENWDQEYLLNDIDSGLSTLIEDYCQEMLLDDIEDWWNDEGGRGYVYIDVELGTYTINNSVRVTEYEDYHHEGNLKDKNKK
jgi:hypothetical protein